MICSCFKFLIFLILHIILKLINIYYLNLNKYRDFVIQIKKNFIFKSRKNSKKFLFCTHYYYYLFI